MGQNGRLDVVNRSITIVDRQCMFLIALKYNRLNGRFDVVNR